MEDFKAKAVNRKKVAEKKTPELVKTEIERILVPAGLLD